jgi:transcriptional regulator with XRE-family HTH domain
MKGWTQEQVAERCRTTQKVYWSWEKGKQYPQERYRKVIAKTFGVSVEDIFGN